MKIFIWFLCSWISLGYTQEEEKIIWTEETSDIYAIENEEKNDIIFYNDRADAFFAAGQYREALEDYKSVLERIGNAFSMEDKSNLLRGICGSLFCYEALNETKLAEKKFQYLVKKVTLLKDELDDIDWINNSPVYCRYKMAKLDCEKCEKKQHLEQIKKMAIPEITDEENCLFQCKGYAVAAAYACSRIPNAGIQFICLGCIFGLEDVCSRCCKGKGFWENCAKPLRRLFHDPEHPENPAPHPYE